MRLGKADAATAKTAVTTAFNGGVICRTPTRLYKHDANYVNGVGNTLNSTEAANYY